MALIAVSLFIISLVLFIIASQSYNNDGIMIVAGVLFLCSMFVAEYAVDQYTCNSKWAMSGTPTNYSVTTGCMIKVDNKWIPEKNYRYEDKE